jgi:hypothetical protein
MIRKFTGELEIDTDRGVIYFHDSDPMNAITVLRICKLDGLKALRDWDQLDITVGSAILGGTRLTVIPKGQIGQ